MMTIPNIPINGFSFSAVGNALSSATTGGTKGSGLVNTVTGFIKDNPNIVNTATGLINQYTGSNIPVYQQPVYNQPQQQISNNTGLWIMGGIALLAIGYTIYKNNNE